MQRQFGTNYMMEVAYSGSRDRERGAQDRPEPGAAVRRRDRPERQPAVRAARPALRDRRHGVEHRLPEYNGLLVKFQRRFANEFSFLNSYTYGRPST